jgi:hypothetical protein
MNARALRTRCAALLGARGARAGAERGGVAALVAVLLGSGAVFGIGALAVDGGTLYTARRQVQTGADAAAFALARACAKKDTAGCTNSPGTLDSLVQGNATIGNGGTVVSSCIRSHSAAGDTVQGVCADPSLGTLTSCPYPLPSAAGAVQVRASTQVPRFFSAFWQQGDVSVGACASAAWGPSLPSVILPVTTSLCSWQAATKNGTFFAPNPGDSAYTPAIDVTGKHPQSVPVGLQPYLTSMVQHDSSGTKCWGSQAGQYIPGGFGWLSDTGSCNTALNADTGTVYVDTGASIPTACNSKIAGLVGTVVYVPVFTNLGGTGSGGWYTIDGIAAFYVAGYRNVPSAQPKSLNGYQSSTVCSSSSSTTCIWGWFTAPLVPAGTFGTGTARGPQHVGMTG